MVISTSSSRKTHVVSQPILLLNVIVGCLGGWVWFVFWLVVWHTISRCVHVGGVRIVFGFVSSSYHVVVVEYCFRRS